MFCPKCGNQMEQNVKFCTRCGASLIDQNNVVNNNSNNYVNGYQNNNYNMPINNNYNQPYPNNNQYQNNPFNNGNQQYNGNMNNMPYQPTYINSGKNYKWLAALGALVAIIILAIAVVTLVNNKKENYYFDENGYDNGSNDSGTTSSSSKKTGKYTTVIVTDNVYNGVDINSYNDANDLIIKDSVSQKNQCPSEIKNIENELINTYGITAVNLCEMDLDFAREVLNVFKKVYSEFPSIRGYLTNLSLNNASMSNDYIAAFAYFCFFASDNDSSAQVFKYQILLNTAYFLNPERIDLTAKRGSEEGHFPPNATRYSPVAHELGHYMSFLATMKHHNINSVVYVDDYGYNNLIKLSNDRRNWTFTLEMLNEAYENYKRDKGTTLSFDAWRGTISQYALAKDEYKNYIYDETIAEAFHDVYLNGNNATDASKYIVAVLKSKLEG